MLKAVVLLFFSSLCVSDVALPAINSTVIELLNSVSDNETDAFFNVTDGHNSTTVFENSTTKKDISRIISTTVMPNVTVDELSKQKVKGNGTTEETMTAEEIANRERWFIVVVIILAVLFFSLMITMLILLRIRIKNGEKAKDIFKIQ